MNRAVCMLATCISVSGCWREAKHNGIALLYRCSCIQATFEIDTNDSFVFDS